MALAAVDWDWVKRQASVFFGREHRGVAARWIPRPTRLVDSPSRAAFILCNKRRHQEGIDLGAQPCCRCGAFTHSWCETCEHPQPQALCTECDQDKLICLGCLEKGRSYPDRTESVDDVVEISGYNDASGQFIPITPAVRVPLSEVPVTTDGEIDLDALIARARRSQPSGSTGGSAQ